LVVENRQVTMQDASLLNEFVIMTLATSAPGKIMQLNGTDSAAAGVDSKPASSTRQEMTDRDPMRLAKATSPPPFSRRH
jgi:hypothetical protein